MNTKLFRQWIAAHRIALRSRSLDRARVRVCASGRVAVLVGAAWCVAVSPCAATDPNVSAVDVLMNRWKDQSMGELKQAVKLMESGDLEEARRIIRVEKALIFPKWHPGEWAYAVKLEVECHARGGFDPHALSAREVAEALKILQRHGGVEPLVTIFQGRLALEPQAAAAATATLERLMTAESRARGGESYQMAWLLEIEALLLENGAETDGRDERIEALLKRAATMREATKRPQDKLAVGDKTAIKAFLNRQGSRATEREEKLKSLSDVKPAN